MEQKLASFRARRRSKNAEKERRISGLSGDLTGEDAAATPETTTAAGSQPPPQPQQQQPPPPQQQPPPQQPPPPQPEVEVKREVKVKGAEPAAAPAPAPAPPGSSHGDWLLDSCLGRWLVSRQLVLSNLTLLKVLLWLALLGLFVELEFGMPFFLLSLFYWLYKGFRRPAPQKPGELSAYSVFNPGCQRLPGSLTAEQLEGEMGYRPPANR